MVRDSKIQTKVNYSCQIGKKTKKGEPLSIKELHFIDLSIMSTQKVYGMGYTCTINQKTMTVGKKQRMNVMGKVKRQKLTPLPLLNLALR